MLLLEDDVTLKIRLNGHEADELPVSSTNVLQSFCYRSCIRAAGCKRVENNIQAINRKKRDDNHENTPSERSESFQPVEMKI